MTTVADLTDLVPTEKIESFIEGANLAPPTALAIAWTGAVGKGSGNNVVLPRFDNITVPAGTKAENADFALVPSTTSSSSVSGGWVGHSDQVSWESNNQSLVDSVRATIENSVAHVRGRLDADGLGTLAGFTTDGGPGVAQPLTDDDVIAALATFVAQHPNPSAGGRGVALGIAQVRDWAQDLNSAGGAQLGGDAESERVAQVMGFREGYVGVRHRLQIFVSGNVSITGGGADGAMMNLGRGGPLVYRSWAPLGFESEWQPRGKRWETTVAANYGWTLANQNNGIGLISQGT